MWGLMFQVRNSLKFYIYSAARCPKYQEQGRFQLSLKDCVGPRYKIQFPKHMKLKKNEAVSALNCWAISSSPNDVLLINLRVIFIWVMSIKLSHACVFKIKI
jgi:hypothetical protein